MASWIWSIFLIIIIIIIIIILVIIIYFEIFRYIGTNYATPCDVLKMDRSYKSKKRVNINRRVVISLTSIPDRVLRLAPTLYSILTQSVKVDEIRINLPYKSLKGQEYIIPPWLEQCQNIKIYRVEKDLGPATKLLPTLKDEKPNTCIIIIDDDRIYGSNFVYHMVNTFKEHNYQEAITNYGSTLHENYYYERMLNFFNGGKYVPFLTGCSGYILTGDMLPKEIFNYDGTINTSNLDETMRDRIKNPSSPIPKEAVYVDDNWISGWLSLNGVKIYMMGCQYGNLFLPAIGSMDTVALCQTHNRDGSNCDIVNGWFIRRGAFC